MTEHTNFAPGDPIEWCYDDRGWLPGTYIGASSRGRHAVEDAAGHLRCPIGVRPPGPITLRCLTETPPYEAVFEINNDDDYPRLHITIGGQAVVLAFDDVFKAVTTLQDRALGSDA